MNLAVRDIVELLVAPPKVRFGVLIGAGLHITAIDTYELLHGPSREIRDGERERQNPAYRSPGLSS
jgi:hypothetical protein